MRRDVTIIAEKKLPELSGLMRRNWEKPCWEFDEAFLHDYLDRPYYRPVNVASGYLDGQLIGFQAHFPLQLSYQNRRIDAVFASFLTADRSQIRTGVAKAIQQNLIDRAIEQGYDYYLTMCEEGAVSNNAVKKTFKSYDKAPDLIRTFGYLMATRQRIARRVSEPEAQAMRRVTQLASQDLDRVQGSDEVGGKLRKLLTIEELNFMASLLDQYYIYAYYIDGEVGVLVVLSHHRVVDQDEIQSNIYLEYFLAYNLSDRKTLQVCNALFSCIANEVAFDYCFIPDLGVLSPELLRRFGFRAAPRKLNLYAVPLKPDLPNLSVADTDKVTLEVF